MLRFTEIQGQYLIQGQGQGQSQKVIFYAKVIV